MGAITALFNSEKGLVALLLLIGSIVLAAIGTISGSDWINYSQVIFGVYVGGKTLQGAATAFANRPLTAAQPASAPAVAVVTTATTATDSGSAP